MSFIPWNLVVTCLLGVVTCIQNDVCEDGWVNYAGSCYRFVQDYPTTLRDALESCAFLDSRLAFAETDSEVTFLSKYVTGQNASGWYVGYQTSVFEHSGEPESHIFVPNWNGQWVETEDDATVKFPETGTEVDETSKCVAFHPSWSQYGTLSREPCRVRLAYVCTGTKEEAVNPDLQSEHWINGNNVFMYVSKTSDQLSYSDAKKSCQDKGLSLMILNKETSSEINQYLFGISDAWSNGMWWTGLQATDNEYHWVDGSSYDSDVVSFTVDREFGYSNWMLMADGKIRPALNTYTNKFPYICKKTSFPASNYGCPTAWYRAGTSCYYKAVANMNQSNASRKCSVMGAHLLSVNSHDEKLWLERSTFLQEEYQACWTSLNDKAKEGEYVWADGTMADKELLKWVQPLSNVRGQKRNSQLRAEGRTCAVFQSSQGTLGIYDCERNQPIACQYTLSTDGATTCLQDWLQYKGTCYYISDWSKSQHWSTNLAACVSIVEETDPTIQPEFIKIESVDLVTFLSNNTRMDFWTGLTTVDSPPMFLWKDGSKPDLSIFKNVAEPDNGNGNGEQDCAAIRAGAVFEDLPCDHELSYICEKELA